MREERRPKPPLAMLDSRSVPLALLLLFLVLCVVGVRPAGTVPSLFLFRSPPLRSFPELTSTSPTSGTWSLTLVHSQDSYGAVVAVDGANNPCTPVGLSYAGEGLAGCLGGNARREAAIAQLRSNASTNLLVVDTGNVFSGNVIFGHSNVV